VGEALQQGADTLLTCGGRDSNGCRAVAAVAARLGLRAVLAVREEAGPPDGNRLLARLLGAETRPCSDAELARPDELLAAIAAEIRRDGGRPYVIPESGAGELGALGYLECAVELAEQIHHGAPRFDTIVVSVGSGGSHAGLLMGKQLAGLPGEIVGVPVAAPAAAARARRASPPPSARPSGASASPSRCRRPSTCWMGIRADPPRRRPTPTSTSSPASLARKGCCWTLSTPPGDFARCWRR
jgi:D-cysteine desulfhydrase